MTKLEGGIMQYRGTKGKLESGASIFATASQNGAEDVHRGFLSLLEA